MGLESARVLFVPFDFISGPARALPSDRAMMKRPGDEYLSDQKNLNWIAPKKKSMMDKKAESSEAAYDIYQVWYTGQRSPLIAGLGRDGQIYIRGHSLKGLDHIYSHAGLNEQGWSLFKSAEPAYDQIYEAINPRDYDKRHAFALSAAEVFNRLKTSGLQPDFEGSIKCYNCHSGKNEKENGSIVKPGFAQALAEQFKADGYTKCRIFGYRGKLSSSYEDFDGESHKTSTDDKHQVKRASAARKLIQERDSTASSSSSGT
jgi:hypothetical protein